MLRRSMSWLAAILLLLGTTRAGAEPYPARPIRTVITTSAGGGLDAAIRTIGERITTAGRGQVVVENKPGANGFIAVDAVKRAPADGYNLLVVDSPLMALLPHLYKKKLPFEPLKDFDAVAPLYSTHFFVIVSAHSPWTRMSDLIAAARAEPNKVTYGTWGVGSMAHVGAAQLEAQTNTQMTHISYKEVSQLYTAVATGEIGWAFGSVASVRALYKDNRVKLLALAAPTRMAEFPEVPTVAESGGPADYAMKVWVALVAPKGTPKAAIAHLHAAATDALRDRGVRNRLMSFGFEPWIGEPADLVQAIERDSLTYARIVEQTRMSLD